MEKDTITTAYDGMLTYPRSAVALQDLDLKSLEASASGGAFAVLARAVLERGGAVFGASLFDGGKVRHVCARTIIELRSLQGSKYVKSDVGKTYEECATLLGLGVEVLYSGTPCQIAGLRSYLNKRVSQEVIDDKLLCVDLICHGTPRQEIFAAYMEWLSDGEKTDDGIHSYIFRSKEMGWGLYYYYYYYRGGKKFEKFGPAHDDPYFSAFTRGFIFRRCCYKCPYARLERVGDITIGDYWGVENVHPDFYDERGVSAVLLNTAKGEIFFNKRCADGCRWVVSNPKDVAAYNANLIAPAARTDEDEVLAEEVERAVMAGDYEKAFDQLLAPKLSVTAKIRRTLPRRFVRALVEFRRRWRLLASRSSSETK